MIVSWYSSSVACSASCRTARGSTVRAKATATASDRPSDITTLQGKGDSMAQCMQSHSFHSIGISLDNSC
jgi:hypothetical protein